MIEKLTGRRTLLAAAGVGLALAGPVAAARAATITPNTKTDELIAADGLCSLREAISAIDSPPGNGDCTAPTAGGANTIVLGAGTYSVSIPGANETLNATGDLDVFGTTTALTIQGAGPGVTTINATGLGDRILNIISGPSVTLSGLTLTGGTAPAGVSAAAGSNGGAIEAARPLTLDDVTVTGNQAGNGAGGTSSSNTGGAGGNGGGIYSTNTVTIQNRSFVSNNHAGTGGLGFTNSATSSGPPGGDGGPGGSGGGVYDTGTLTVTGSTIGPNQSGSGGNGGVGGLGTTAPGRGGTGGAGGNAGAGAGILSTPSLTVTGSTIVNNIGGTGGTGGLGGDGLNNGGSGGNGGAGSLGAGISAIGELGVTNTTLTGNDGGTGGTGGTGGVGNSATGGNGGSGGTGGAGGAIESSLTANGSVTNVTISGNAAGGGGGGGTGGIGATNGGHGSAGGTGSGGDIDNAGGSTVTLKNSITTAGGDCVGVTDAGHNLSHDACLGAAGPDPLLGPLKNNGGPTLTMALLPGSPAINQVPATGAGCPATDQRGVARPAGPACDIGAYEFAPPVAVTDAASALSTSGATLNGTVTPDDTDSSVHFEWGLTTAYGTSTAVQHVDGVIAQAVSAMLTGLRPGTTYHFRVVATNTEGTTDGADMTFTVLGGPVVTRQPRDQSICAGASASFTAAFSGSPTPTIQWQQSTNGLSTFTDVAGATSATLSVVTRAVSQSGIQYRAVGHNSIGPDATTRAATLTVSAPCAGGTHKPAKPHLTSKVKRRKRQAKFTFRDANTTGFDCALIRKEKGKHAKQSKPRFKLCRSPKTYKKLAPGRYEFFVHAFNRFGAGPNATVTFRI